MAFLVPRCSGKTGGRGAPSDSEIQSQGAIVSVKKEASGRSYVQSEVEVPGTPEEVWQAIAARDRNNEEDA